MSKYRLEVKFKGTEQTCSWYISQKEFYDRFIQNRFNLQKRTVGPNFFRYDYESNALIHIYD